ncbi:MAG: ASCH domain-containing protein [Clostridiales bacterium]|nr:ASCH domain-containing protein [Clostridiales bacterium]
MLYEMKLLENEFDNIMYKNKVIEVRINDAKRKHIQKGDKIVFYKLPDMRQSIIVNVEQVIKFNSFQEVYRSFPVSYFGYNNSSINNLVENIYKIYTKEEEKNNGVIAIKFNVERILLNTKG